MDLLKCFYWEVAKIKLLALSIFPTTIGWKVGYRGNISFMFNLKKKTKIKNKTTTKKIWVSSKDKEKLPNYWSNDQEKAVRPSVHGVKIHHQFQLMLLSRYT